jgi:hypothetical protein
MRLFGLLLVTTVMILVSAAGLGGQGAAADSSDFGIIGTTGTEQTLEALYALKRIEEASRTGGFTVYYVSTKEGGDYPEGDDANPGTAAQPWRTLDRVDDFLDNDGDGRCGVEIVFDGGETWTGADLGSGLDKMLPTCTGDPDEPAIYLRSSDPDSQVTFDCTDATPALAGLIQTTSTTADGGWVVVEGIHVRDCPADNFDTAGDYAKMVVVNSGGKDMYGSGNQVFTAHNDSALIGLNVYGNSLKTGSGSPIPISSAGTSKTIIISDEAFYVDDDGTGEGGAVIGTGSPMVVIGPDLYATENTTGDVNLLTLDAPANQTCNVTLARVEGYDWPGGAAIRLKASNPNATVNFNVYQSTFVSGSHGIRHRLTDDSSTINFTGRCLLFDELSSFTHEERNGLENVSFDIQDSIYDDDDVTDSWRIDPNSYETYDDPVDGVYAAVSDEWPDFFTNSYDSGGAGDGVQWDGDGDLATPGDTRSNHACHPNNECWGACDLEYTIPLPISIPAFVLGAEVTEFRLNGQDGDIGGRGGSFQCDDGVDNDGDGFVDLADPGCGDADDDSERDAGLPCDDGVDNDGDGFVDLADPGCTDVGDESEKDAGLVCDDGVDNDGDGLIDAAEDPGCADASDASETDETGAFPCDDGVDNDADTLADYPADPGCENPHSGVENPECQDGQNNDPAQDPNPGLIDFDGGQSIHGECTGEPGGCPPLVSDPEGDGLANPDPQCVGKPWQDREKAVSCGLGAELAMLLPPLMWLWRRRSLH